MSTRPYRILSNLICATNDLLSSEQIERISGNGIPEKPGIDANNRLIRGQVFLWPEVEGDWRILWNDSQLFETKKAYENFKIVWKEFKKVKQKTTYQSKYV